MYNKLMSNNSLKNTYSITFEYDTFIFETNFEFEQGESGDGYMQPDDTDHFEIRSTFIIGALALRTDIEPLMIKEAREWLDVSDIIDEDVKKARDEAIKKEIECHILQP